MADRLTQIRKEAGEIISAGGDTFAHSAQYLQLCEEFIQLGGSKNDTIIMVAEKCLGFYTKDGENDRSQQGPYETAPLEGSIRLEFDYLETFMKECFLAAGVPDKEAGISANVLIEADKRGIDSHGIGRLKVGGWGDLCVM
jgi:hypothetical protein